MTSYSRKAVTRRSQWKDRKRAVVASQVTRMKWRSGNKPLVINQYRKYLVYCTSSVSEISHGYDEKVANHVPKCSSRVQKQIHLQQLESMDPCPPSAFCLYSKRRATMIPFTKVRSYVHTKSHNVWPGRQWLHCRQDCGWNLNHPRKGQNVAQERCRPRIGITWQNYKLPKM